MPWASKALPGWSQGSDPATFTAHLHVPTHLCPTFSLHKPSSIFSTLEAWVHCVPGVGFSEIRFLSCFPTASLCLWWVAEPGLLEPWAPLPQYSYALAITLLLKNLFDLSFLFLWFCFPFWENILNFFVLLYLVFFFFFKDFIYLRWGKREHEQGEGHREKQVFLLLVLPPPPIPINPPHWHEIWQYERADRLFSCIQIWMALKRFG